MMEAMTVDERLDKLTERHEALTQTVELLAHEVGELRVAVDKTNESLAGLISVVLRHENRLNDLEEGAA